MRGPTTTFLISDHVPFEVCPLSHTVRPVEPVLDIYDLSNPAPNLPKRWPFPREIADKIVDFVILGHFRSKEFFDAVQMMSLDKSTIARWYRNLINPAPPQTMAHRHVLKGAQLSRLLFLLMSIFECTYDFSVFPLAEDLKDFVEDVPSRDNILVVAVKHPYGMSIDGAIKPHHLVARLQGEQRWGLQYAIVPYPLQWVTVRFSDFENPPTLAWTGHRVCDALVLDAQIKDGFYHARKVRHPFLVLRIDTELQDASEEWQEVRWQWERFAELVHCAYEKAELYIADAHHVLHKVLQ
jgi:hypothetical protein